MITQQYTDQLIFTEALDNLMLYEKGHNLDGEEV